jgi:isopenicillin-N epimerase
MPLMAKTPDETVDAVAAALTPNTRLLFFSHVYSATGLITPAAAICELARRRGIITVVDGAHAPGMVPLEIDSLGCDYYGANCHKWLLAPIGSGFLAFREGAMDKLEPLQVSWGYRPDASRLNERDEFGSTWRIRQFECEGTRDPCAWLAIPEAIDFQSKLGFSAIHQRMRQLSAHARKRFATQHGLRLTTPTDPAMHGAMTTYWWPPGLIAESMRQKLWNRRIEAVIGEWPEGLTLRVSNHFYTTESEIDRLADAIPELLQAT